MVESEARGLNLLLKKKNFYSCEDVNLKDAGERRAVFVLLVCVCVFITHTREGTTIAFR